jgi:GTP:adenosylcobinamide-phosphate guanylyltransferase
MRALVVTNGPGSRLADITGDKSLLPLGEGQPIVAGLVTGVNSAGMSEVTVMVRPGAKARYTTALASCECEIVEWEASGYLRDVGVWSEETSVESLVLVDGDQVLDPNDIRKFVDRAWNSAAHTVLSGVAISSERPSEDTRPGIEASVKDGAVLAVGSEVPVPSHTLVGLYRFTTVALDLLRRGFPRVRSFLAAATELGPVEFVELATAINVNTPNDWRRASSSGRRSDHRVEGRPTPPVGRLSARQHSL